MKTTLLSLTVVMVCAVTVKARAVYPDILLQQRSTTQEQAPASPLQCFVCQGPTLENCTAGQFVDNCTSGMVCYTIQAFDSVQNEFINSKGCFPEFLCGGNQGCDMVNISRNGAIQSCSLSCCNTPLCNAPAAILTTPPPVTTQPATTTAAPTTTPPLTTAAVTTAPTTVPPPIPPGLCGGPLTPPSGFFVSPHYPLNYPNNAYCVWSLTVPQGSQLSINFLFFETEHCYDYVNIYVGRRLVRRLSGGEKDDDDDDKDKHRYGDDDKCDDDDDDYDDLDDLDDIDEEEDKGPRVVTIQGTGEMIRIVFRSDYSVTRRGFFARYNVAAASPVLCGGPLVGPSGSFTSPGFPGNYPNNADCRWTIVVPLGSTMVLEFRSFETERCDYIQILQGWRAIRRLSGVYGRKDDDDDKYDDDDDCDDDDDDDDDDGDDGGDDKSSYKWKGIFGRFGHPAGGGRHIFGPPYVKRVHIRGTGEMITIIFRSDHRITRRGFDAMYRLT